MYDPEDPSQAAEQKSSPANPGSDATQSGGNQFDMSGLGGGMGGGMSGMGDMIGQGLGAATDIASGIGDALPGIADMAGSIASGIGSIFASRQDFDDWVRYAYPTADGEGDLKPHTHPFAGSGWPGPLEIGTSEEYADEARRGMEDVTDYVDDPLSVPMDKWQKQGSYDEDGSDIVRAFQANLGETALGSGAGGGGRFDDIAGAAQGFLRTAGRNFSLAEQSELIREGDKGGARNLDSLNLAGTHYEDMNSLGW